MIFMLLIWCIMWAPLSECYSSGQIPSSVCSSMTPGHMIPPQQSSSPHGIRFQTTQYIPDLSLQVTLERNSETPFIGFYCQARTDDDTTVGIFEGVDDIMKARGHRCFSNSSAQYNTVSHNSNWKNDPEVRLAFRWRISTTTNLRITFRCSFVQSYNTFWVMVPSSPLLLLPTATSAVCCEREALPAGCQALCRHSETEVQDVAELNNILQIAASEDDSLCPFEKMQLALRCSYWGMPEDEDYNYDDDQPIYSLFDCCLQKDVSDDCTSLCDPDKLGTMDYTKDFFSTCLNNNNPTLSQCLVNPVIEEGDSQTTTQDLPPLTDQSITTEAIVTTQDSTSPADTTSTAVINTSDPAETSAVTTTSTSAPTSTTTTTSTAASTDSASTSALSTTSSAPTSTTTTTSTAASTSALPTTSSSAPTPTTTPISTSTDPATSNSTRTSTTPSTISTTSTSTLLSTVTTVPITSAVIHTTQNPSAATAPITISPNQTTMRSEPTTTNTTSEQIAEESTTISQTTGETAAPNGSVIYTITTTVNVTGAESNATLRNQIFDALSSTLLSPALSPISGFHSLEVGVAYRSGSLIVDSNVIYLVQADNSFPLLNAVLNAVQEQASSSGNIIQTGSVTWTVTGAITVARVETSGTCNSSPCSSSEVCVEIQPSGFTCLCLDNTNNEVQCPVSGPGTTSDRSLYALFALLLLVPIIVAVVCIIVQKRKKEANKKGNRKQTAMYVNPTVEVHDPVVYEEIADGKKHSIPREKGTLPSNSVDYDQATPDKPKRKEISILEEDADGYMRPKGEPEAGPVASAKEAENLPSNDNVKAESKSNEYDVAYGGPEQKEEENKYSTLERERPTGSRRLDSGEYVQIDGVDDIRPIAQLDEPESSALEPSSPTEDIVDDNLLDTKNFEDTYF